jgi:hypothetical protein
VFIAYMDPQPTGSNKGVMIDNIKIWGLVEEVQPTTPAPPTTPPDETPTTPPPPSTPMPSSLCAFAPFNAKEFDQEDLDELEPLPDVGAWVDFGLSVDAETGEVEGMGGAFQHGIMQLCARPRYWGLEPGTTFKWEWYINGTKFDGLSGSQEVENAEGFVSPCLAGPLDDQNNPLPVPVGEYEVKAFIGDETEPAHSAIAKVEDEVPLCKTPLPGEPTPEPTRDRPTPGPTQEGCSEQLQNGGFEDGPMVWNLHTNTQKQLSDVIVRGADVGINPIGGEWIAALGSGVNVEDQISQPSSATGSLYEPTELMSATLQFYTGYLTAEEKNDVHDDILFPAFLSDTGQQEQPERSGISEEVLPEFNVWYRITVTVTEQMKKREGWDSSRLFLVTANSESAPTTMLIEEVTLVVCLNAAFDAARTELMDRFGLSWLEPRGLISAPSDPRTPGMQIEPVYDRPFPTGIALEPEIE